MPVSENEKEKCPLDHEGVPNEMAVLRRFWIEQHSSPSIAPSDNETDVGDPGWNPIDADIRELELEIRLVLERHCRHPQNSEEKLRTIIGIVIDA